MSVPAEVSPGLLLRFAGLQRVGSMQRVPDEPAPDDAPGLGAANARLRELLAERDAETAGLRADRNAAVS
jgi:hypothetical protein